VTDPEALALDIAARIRAAVLPHLGALRARARVARSPGGDATLAIDEVAEGVLQSALEEEGDIGYYSEDRGLVTYGHPRCLLVVDPIDGTRPAAAGLEGACVSIAVVPPTEDARLGDVSFGVVHELKRGRRFVARRGRGARAEDVDGSVLALGPSSNDDVARAFVAIGTRGRPAVPTAIVLEELIDGSSLGGACFELGSVTFDLTLVATGQIDAYVDVGRRMLDEVPAAEPAFLAVGEGAACTNFPYDVAAGMLVVEESGGVVTHADGRSLADHPAVGSSREHGLALVAAGNQTLHRALIGVVDRGLARLRERWVPS
jgi:myo-inositol-1(or 4)-monophosphatase